VFALGLTICACHTQRTTPARDASASPDNGSASSDDESATADKDDKNEREAGAQSVQLAQKEPWFAQGPGFPESGPWVSFYGSASKMKDLARVANAYRIINVDADPGDDGESNFTDAQLAILRAGGKNRVLSYLDVGSCERTRSYWSNTPAPFVPCAKNRSAQLGAYAGYPEEVWMDPSDASYQALIVDYVAARLAARKVDGFYLDNLEIVEHGKSATNGPCNARCKQGGLDLVKRLRDTYPNLLLVMQNATGRVTRLGVTGGIRFATLLDGIAHEEVYGAKTDANAEAELLAWKQMNLRTKSGRPFWIGTEDYVGNCENQRAAREAWTKSQRHGFSPYVSDQSNGQNVVCYWRF